MNKEQDKQVIFDLVKAYVKKYHQQPEYQEGDYIPYARKNYDENELINLIDASLDFWLTASTYTHQFEAKLGAYLGIPYVSFVNSGSSANLLALACLTSPLLKERQLKKGDEVITVACGFPTTVNPIVQLGMIPVFLDITLPTYNIKVEDLEKAYSPKTKAVMIAHTLGNPFDIEKVKAFCDTHGLWLIEDNCDALGSTYHGQLTGTFGDVATSSFFPAHHITTGEGGAVYTKNPLLHKIIRSMRDWGRDCVCAPGEDNHCGTHYEGKHGSLPKGYDHKYVYSHFGYNLKATDLQAAIGVAQMDKLASFTEKRIAHFHYFDGCIKEAGLEELLLPEAEKDSVPSWFGYLITTKEGVDTVALIRHLEAHGVQTRKLFAGNIVKQPLFEDLEEGKDYRIVGDLQCTDFVMEHSFWLGLHPGMREEMLDTMVQQVVAFFK